MSYAFAGCTSLVDVQLNGTVKSLRETFYDCSAIKALIIPDGVTELYSAFSGCSSLEELTLPDSFRPNGSYTSYYGPDLFNGCEN